MSLWPIQINKDVHIENEQNGHVHFYAYRLTKDEVAFLEDGLDALITDVLRMREERVNP